MKAALLITIFILPLLTKPITAFAHCPLCTIGAGAAAVGASYFGVTYAAIGVFIGAFGIALGLWFAKAIKKQYIPYQYWIIGILSFIVTVLPLRQLMGDYISFPILLSGDYGTLLNRTYIIDSFLLGAILGGILLLITPWISSWVTKLRKGKTLPYQGITLTFILLVGTALLLQLYTG